jgi:hypothetical protein
MVQSGKDIFLPLAKEVWDSTIIKVNILINGCKKIREIQTFDGFLFENTLVQQCLVMLVTELEMYTKNRFLEMEKDGKIANTEALVKEFASSEIVQRELYDYSHANRVTILQSLINLRNNGLINFQDWASIQQRI